MSEWEPRRFHRDLQEIDLRAMERDSSDDESGDEAGKRRPKPNLLDKTNKEEKNGGIGPTAPPYKSVSHVVGYAPANTTSHCKVCGKGFIPKRIRFGTFFEHKEGFVFLRWHHLRCVRPPSSLDNVTSLIGYKDLLPDDFNMVEDWMRGPSVPHRPVLKSSWSSVGETSGMSGGGKTPSLTIVTTSSSEDSVSGAGGGGSPNHHAHHHHHHHGLHAHFNKRPILIKSSSSPPTIDHQYHPHLDGERRLRPISPLEESLGGPPPCIGSPPSRISPGPLCGRQRRIVELSSARAALFLDDDRTLTISPTNGASTPEPRSPRSNGSSNASSPRSYGSPRAASSHHRTSLSPRSSTTPHRDHFESRGVRHSVMVLSSSGSKEEPLRTPSPRELTRRRSRELSRKSRRADSPITGMEGGERKGKGTKSTWDVLKAIAKAVKHRRRGKTIP